MSLIKKDHWPDLLVYAELQDNLKALITTRCGGEQQKAHILNEQKTLEHFVSGWHKLGQTWLSWDIGMMKN